MLSLFEQIANNRLVKSIRKNVLSSKPAKVVEAAMRFAKSPDKLKAADEQVVAGLKSMGLITRDEALALERRIVQLEARLNVLEHGGEIRAKTAAKTKPTTAEAPKRTVAKAAQQTEEAPRTIRDAEASP